MTIYVNGLTETHKVEAGALSASDKNVVVVTMGKISQALTATVEDQPKLAINENCIEL